MVNTKEKSSVHPFYRRLEEDVIKNLLELNSPLFSVASIHDINATELLVRKMKDQGIGVGGLNESVCYIIGDASNPNFLESVAHLKGQERKSMTMALSHSPEFVFRDADLDKIPEPLQKYFTDTDLAKETFGGLAFLRFPVKPSSIANWPASVISGVEDGNPMIQNWIPSELMRSLVEKMEDENMVVGITSLNRHGQNEEVNQLNAAKLASNFLGGFLYDERFPNNLAEHLSEDGNPLFPHGSFPVLEIGKHINEDGIALVRRGPIDPRTFPAILKIKGLQMDLSRKKWPLYNLPDEFIDALENASESGQARNMLLEYLRLLRVELD